MHVFIYVCECKGFLGRVVVKKVVFFLTCCKLKIQHQEQQI